MLSMGRWVLGSIFAGGLLLAWTNCCLAQSGNFVTRGQDSGDVLPATEPAGDKPPKSVDNSTPDDGEHAAAPSAKPDPRLLGIGKLAFDCRCIQCHDAQKSLQKMKSLSGWRSTVQRMAQKDGAEIPSQEMEPISAYLASLNPTSSGNVANSAEGNALDQASEERNLAIYSTFSPTWRGGNGDLQNPGFVPDIWAGVAWQSSTSALSARATACFSCHTEAGLGSRIEMVEAAVRLDLSFLLTGCRGTVLRSAAEAGRFIVPFGVFAQQSNPGVYRTVSKPLMYNMGFRVSDGRWGDPVLPMPYSDEGAKLDFTLDLTDAINTTLNVYVVNGLQGANDGIDFDLSRDYVDNNRRPAVGGRWTIGSAGVRFGASYMSGVFSPTGGVGPANSNLSYQIFGADVQARWKDLLRFQAEYARRDSDRIVNLPGQLLSTDATEGVYVEAELLVHRKWAVSLLSRYDWQRKNSPLPPPGSDLTVGQFSVQRVTTGMNKVLPGGSLLMFNHEYWIFPQGYSNIHVWGMRWAASF